MEKGVSGNETRSRSFPWLVWLLLALTAEARASAQATAHSPVHLPVLSLAGETAPVPRPNGAQLLADDFDNADQSAEPAYDPEWMRFKLTDSSGRLSTRTPSKEVAAIYPAPQVADFFADLDVRFARPDAEGAGLFFRSASLDKDLAWYYHVGLHPVHETVRFSVTDEGLTDVRSLDECKMPAGSFDPAGYNHFRVEALATQFRVFVNDAFVCDFEDDTLSEPGLIGLFVDSPDEMDQGAEEVAYFRQLRGRRSTVETPSPQVNGDLLLADEFADDGLDRQPVFDEEWMAFKRVKGAGRLTAYAPGVALPLMYGEPEIADFYAEFDVRAVGAQQDSTYGLTFVGMRHRTGWPDTMFWVLSRRPTQSLSAPASIQNGCWAKQFRCRTVCWSQGKPITCASKRSATTSASLSTTSTSSNAATLR